MPLDPRAARFLEMTAAAAAGQRARDIAGRRRAVQQLMGFARADRLCPPGDDIALEHAGRTVGARLYRPEGAVADPSGPVIAFIHGGGLVAGSLDTHDTIARALCAESCCTLVAVAYRLAPEHPFPAAIEDVSSALAALSRESGARAGATRTRAPHIALCAESGGAAPALAAATQTRLPLAAISLVCPALEFATPTRSREEFAQGYLIDAQTLADDLADYLPRGVRADDPRVSPLRMKDLSHLPATFVHTAEYDPLRDEGDAFARALSAAGVAVTHHRHPGMVHNFHALGAVLPQGRAGLSLIGRELGQVLGTLGS